ncbi:MAG: putative rane protein [Panacagrimonas sp.]|jgi:hypothetical protein|nr:DUF2938 domain-containing protein [Panacagrimonas sp.]MCC2659120.1 putative rane protein [Panacagrimonas sp.]
MSTTATVVSIVAIGCGATLVMDVWLIVLRRLGVRTLDFALIGRWAVHVLRGRFVHDAIAKAEPVRGEAAIGWSVHYGVGIAFAALLVAISGTGWIEEPTLGPAIFFGLISVSAPLLIMQPAMGSGFLASRTASPLANCVRSAVNHGVFGTGLYVTALVFAHIG